MKKERLEQIREVYKQPPSPSPMHDHSRLVALADYVPELLDEIERLEEVNEERLRMITKTRLAVDTLREILKMSW